MTLRVRQAVPSSRAARRGRRVAYHRILVPVVDGEVSEQAVSIACQLAAERKASVTAVTVVEVPVELPLDSHMFDEERAAKRVLAEAAAIGDLYGITVSGLVLRGRAAGETIVQAAGVARTEIIVLSAPRKFGSTVDVVLKQAPCRVMVAATPGDR